MPGHDIVVIGFSAGGIDPLLQMVSRLPRDLPASLFVVHHFPAQAVSALPAILNRAGTLPATAPSDEQGIERGHIYVAPQDFHLLVRQGVMRLTRGPREHGPRPAVDPLFRSAARSYGPRVIGVVLSGTLKDGTEGLQAIKAAGGLALVQDPATCAYSGMPSSALELVSVDQVARPEELGATLVRLVGEPAGPQRQLPETDELDARAAREAEHGSSLTRASPRDGTAGPPLRAPVDRKQELSQLSKTRGG